MKQIEFTPKRFDDFKPKTKEMKITGWKDNADIIIAVLVIFVSISMLSALFSSSSTNNLYRTAFSYIPYRLLSALTILMLCALFTGIYIFWAEKRASLKGFLKILPYTVVTGIIYHVIAINLLLNLNQWMTGEQTYEKKFKVVKVSTQVLNKFDHLLHSLCFLPPAFKELKVADPDVSGKFLYFYAYPNFSIDPGYTLKATLCDGIFGWKVVKEIRKVYTYEVKDLQDYSGNLNIESN